MTSVGNARKAPTFLSTANAEYARDVERTEEANIYLVQHCGRDYWSVTKDLLRLEVTNDISAGRKGPGVGR